MEKKSAFAQYIERLFVDWQAKQKRRASVDEFASYMGCSQAAVSLWMADRRKPNSESIHRIYELYGPEIYDVLNLPRPDPLLDYVITHWDRLRPEKQLEIREEIEKYLTEGRTVAHEADQS
jgi:transcriptional regulator with XRE-family HTH domain